MHSAHLSSLRTVLKKYKQRHEELFPTFTLLGVIFSCAIQKFKKKGNWSNRSQLISEKKKREEIKCALSSLTVQSAVGSNYPEKYQKNKKANSTELKIKEKKRDQVCTEFTNCPQ